MGGVRLARGPEDGRAGRTRAGEGAGTRGPGHSRNCGVQEAGHSDGLDYNSILIAWGLCCLKLPRGSDGNTFTSLGYFSSVKKKRGVGNLPGISAARNNIVTVFDGD